MIERRGEAVHDSPERRERLSREYSRIIDQTKAVLCARQNVAVLNLRYDEILRDPAGAAQQIALFAGRHLDVTRMAAAVEPSLYRNRATR